MTEQTTSPQIEALTEEIKREIAEYKILVYSKGTDAEPRCGYTIQTKDFLAQYGHPVKFIDVLDTPEKRQLLNEMFEWPTLPKVFINGKFHGDTDILEPMAQNGELDKIMKEAFGG